jgi:hypothetical protein
LQFCHLNGVRYGCDSSQVLSLLPPVFGSEVARLADQHANSDMNEMAKANLSREQISKLKRRATRGRPYADRISLQFALRLVLIATELGEDHLVLHELDYLERLRPDSRTKPEAQFKHAPLHPFWHKHYSSARHMPRNLSTRWGLYADGNRDLTKLMEQLIRNHGPDDLDKFSNDLAYRMVIDGYTDRAKRGLTGDWIIFGKQDGQNYYLDVVEHGEPSEHDLLYKRLHESCAAEFPSLFAKAG